MLLAQPDELILEATVAGVSGGRTSDEKIPRAWVVLSEAGKRRGPKAVVNALDAWTRRNLSKYKWLRGGFEIVDEVGLIQDSCDLSTNPNRQIPKLPTGKVLRRVLQEKYEASRSHPMVKL